MRRHLFAAMLVLLPTLPAAAQSGFKGEINAEAGYADNSSDSLDAAWGERSHGDTNLDLRLMWSGALVGNWNVDAAYLAQARHGGDVVLQRNQRTATIDPYRTAWWPLQHTVSDHDRTYIDQRIDRLALGYSNANLVLRLGRQALTWGSGLVFHPMDLFNPFSPNATYTSYKPGGDMLYGQWLFDSGADLQGVAVPRRDPVTGRLTSAQSSAGMKWHGFAGQTGFDLLLARDYSSAVFGIGASGALGDASWSAEAIPTHLDGGATFTSLLANMQYAWNWDGRNLSGYLEYFRNGFGVGGSGHTLADLPASLTERLAHGELFNVSKDYLATGMGLQWTPLFTLKPTIIFNLNDGSLLLIGQAVYSLSQNTSLTAGLQWGAGRNGSGYGGLETAPGSNLFAVPADRLYARLTWYL
jgi:hypothetical protein